jgi:UDP-glucuronate 4-epimerase
VYGNSDSANLSESLLGIHPISFYGATKLTNEILAKSLAFSSNTKFRGLRFFTVYGPWGRPDMAYLKLIDAAINKKSFELFGDGTKTRDFTYIDDVVSSVMQLSNQLATKSAKFSDVVNVGGGRPVSMIKLVETVENELKLGITLSRGPDVAGDVSNTNANTEYLKSLVAIQNFVEIQVGIKHTVDWAVRMNDSGNLKNWLQ